MPKETISVQSANKKDLKKLPDRMKLKAFTHCGEPLEMLMGSMDGDDTSDYFTYAGCRICKMLLLVKSGPWDKVEVFDGTSTKVI